MGQGLGTHTGAQAPGRAHLVVGGGGFSLLLRCRSLLVHLQTEEIVILIVIVSSRRIRLAISCVV